MPELNKEISEGMENIAEEAVKAESKAQWEEAKMSPKVRQEKMQAEREQQIAKAKERTAAAQARIDAVKK